MYGRLPSVVTSYMKVRTVKKERSSLSWIKIDPKG